MFTVARLGIDGRLAKTLTTSNPVESMISIARATNRNVTRWRDAIARISAPARAIWARWSGRVSAPVSGAWMLRSEASLANFYEGQPDSIVSMSSGCTARV